MVQTLELLVVPTATKNASGNRSEDCNESNETFNWKNENRSDGLKIEPSPCNRVKKVTVWNILSGSFAKLER